MTELPWLTEAKKDIGLHEIAGPRHNPDIVKMWKVAKIYGFTDDETPWCAGFVSAKLEAAGVKSTRSAWARSYCNWGVRLKGPAVGAVVVFSRGKTSGHVGFVVGKDGEDNLMVLGGNQGDAVNIKAFSTDRVLSYRWPSKMIPPVTGFKNLPRVHSDGSVSTNEA